MAQGLSKARRKVSSNIPFVPTGGNLVLNQSATLFMSETTNHIASLNNRNNEGLGITYDEHRCKQIDAMHYIFAYYKEYHDFFVLFMS